jgi:bifunctional non-homologous end joining protein LigD
MSTPQGSRTGLDALPQIEPIIPVERPTAFDDPAWLFEPKYDGLRGLLYLAPDGCEIRSKKGLGLRRFDSLCGGIRAQLAAHMAILDGEIVALDRAGRPQFFDLLSLRHPRLVYVAFDLLWVDGRDLRRLALAKRKAHLAAVLPNASSVVFQPYTEEKHGWGLLEVVQRLDLEGIIAKRKADPYYRKTVWYKVENPGYTQKRKGGAELFEWRRW